MDERLLFHEFLAVAYRPGKARRAYLQSSRQEKITEFFMKRLQGKFAAVAKPGFLYNSRGLLFVLMFCIKSVALRMADRIAYRPWIDMKESPGVEKQRQERK